MESSTMNDIQAMQAIVELSEHVDSETLIPAVKSILLPYYSQWQTVVFSEAIEYLEFAAKGKSGKPRNCKKGYACGNGCISRTKECRKKHGAEAQVAQEWLKSNGALSDEQAKELEDLINTPSPSQQQSGGGGADQEPEQTTEPQDIQSGQPDATIDSIPDEHKDFVDPLNIEITEEMINQANGFIDSDDDLFIDSFQVSKQDAAKAVAPDMTDDEARALAVWTSNKYGDMNKAFYAPDSDPAFGENMDQVMAANRLAAKGLAKMPALNSDDVAARAKAHEEKTGTKQTAYDPEKPLTRFMTMDDPEGFVSRYKNAEGGNIRENTFFATTYLQASDPGMKAFATQANVHFKVNAKHDGTGQGRYIDDMKNRAVEGEILFGPYSKFRVKKVTDGGYNAPALENGKMTVGEAISFKNATALMPQKIQDGTIEEKFRWAKANYRKNYIKANVDKNFIDKMTIDDYQEYLDIKEEETRQFNSGNFNFLKPRPYLIELDEV